MEEIYLDNSATTKVCKSAADQALYAMRECYGNPSSLYSLGLNAERLIERTRRAVAQKLHCRPEEIVFTGCGTESNNTAVFGAARSLQKRGRRIVTTAVEHPSVARPMDQLEKEGFEVVRLPVDREGKIQPEEIFNAVTKDTILVSMMLVNNETGAIFPVSAAAEAIKKIGAPALLHCDAVQAFGKLPIDPKKLGVDLLSASGHKLHAPKGIGVLYKSEKAHIQPLLLGGGQEKGFRSGTESVPLIAALGGAISELPEESVGLQNMQKLWNYAKESLLKLPGAALNSPDDCLPYLINISLAGYRSETLLHFLEADGIFVSSGSACSKGKLSGVLSAMGLPAARVDSALRISFSRYNKTEDIDKLCESLERAAKRLKKRG